MTAVAAESVRALAPHYHNMVIMPRYLIRSYSLGFEEGCIVKYVGRWRSKEGIKDLRKALDYIRWVMEDADHYIKSRRNADRRPTDITFAEYIQKNELGNREAHIVTLVCTWSELHVKDILPVIRKDILDLIHDAKQEGFAEE